MCRHAIHYSFKQGDASLQPPNFKSQPVPITAATHTPTPQRSIMPWAAHRNTTWEIFRFHIRPFLHSLPESVSSPPFLDLLQARAFDSQSALHQLIESPLPRADKMSPHTEFPPSLTGD